MDQENSEADLRRIPIASVFHFQYLKMNEEFSNEMRLSMNGVRGNFPEMMIFDQMLRNQARGFPDILKKYNEETSKLNDAFGDPYLRNFEIMPQHAQKRKEMLENLAYDLGIIRMDERPEAPARNVYDYGYRYDGRVLVYDLFAQRLQENRNLVVLFSGKVGGGKSYASLSVADYLLPDARVSYELTSMVYSISDFIDRVKKLPAGETIILDEAGLAAGSRDFASKENKVLSKIIQSIRYLKHCSIFSLPNPNFLDKNIRLMVDLIFDHPVELRQGEFVPYVPLLSDDGRDVILEPFTIGSTVIRTVYFPLPRPSLISDYEKKRRTHNLSQLNDLQDSLSPKAETDGRGRNPNSLKNLMQNREDKNE